MLFAAVAVVAAVVVAATLVAAVGPPAGHVAETS